MGRGDSSWQDRNHHVGKPIGGKKTSTGKIAHFFKKLEGVTETTPTGGTSVGTEGYDDTKATTAVNLPSNPQVDESIMNSGGTGANETYDFSKGSKAVSTTTQSTTSKKRKSSLKVNISGAGGTGRNIV
jgi:hypothetical protein